MTGLIEVIRALPRPLLAFVFPVSWVIFVFGIYSSGGTIDDVPDIYTWFVGCILAEYFGERLLLKFKK